MDKTKNPGIAIDKIHLLECTAVLLDVDAKLQYALALTSLTRTEVENNLLVVAGFDLMHELEKPPCVLKCSFGAVYSRTDTSEMTWADFTDVMTVSHIVPYVREFVSSVTLRMPIRELILPPTNVNLLVTEFRNRQETAKTEQKSS